MNFVHNSHFNQLYKYIYVFARITQAILKRLREDPIPDVKTECIKL